MFRRSDLVGAGVGAVAISIGFLIVIGDRAVVGVDLREAARVARSTLEADVGNAAPFGAGVAIGDGPVAGVGLAFDRSPLGGRVGLRQRPGVYFRAGRVAAVVFGDGVGFAGSRATRKFLKSIKRQK